MKFIGCFHNIAFSINYVGESARWIVKDKTQETMQQEILLVNRDDPIDRKS